MEGACGGVQGLNGGAGRAGAHYQDESGGWELIWSAEATVRVEAQNFDRF